MNNRVSIIIVNYKGRSYLDACLSSLFRNDLLVPFEVVVVDNASDDGSVKYIEENFPAVKLIKNKYNYGFATANNQGFNASNGEYLMTLNPDAEIIGESLGKLVEILDARPDIGIICPCIIENDGVVSIDFEFPVISPLKTLRQVGIGRNVYSSDRPPGLKEVSWISGTGYLCRRSALGGTFFDESTFLFGEEYELCHRVRANGFSIAVSPDALIKHIGSVTFRYNKEKSAVARNLMESSCWYMRKKLFGSFSANFHQLFRGLDEATMWALLNLKSRFSKPSEGRDLEISNFKTVAMASFSLIAKGESYFEKVNQESRKYFNGGREIPFPPEIF